MDKNIIGGGVLLILTTISFVYFVYFLFKEVANKKFE